MSKPVTVHQPHHTILLHERQNSPRRNRFLPGSHFSAQTPQPGAGFLSQNGEQEIPSSGKSHSERASPAQWQHILIPNICAPWQNYRIRLMIVPDSNSPFSLLSPLNWATREGRACAADLVIHHTMCSWPLYHNLHNTHMLLISDRA